MRSKRGEKITEEQKPLRIQFWSSVEYGGFLQGLIRELNEIPGVDAEQCYGITEKRYRSARGTVSRLWLRVQQYILYPLYLSWKLIFGQKADVVVVCTNTFYAPLVASFFHKRVVHLVYDLFPEALVHSGKLKRSGVLVNILHRLTQFTIKHASSNVYLGENLKSYVSTLYDTIPKDKVIPIGADAQLFKMEPTTTDYPIEILYCGNFGYMHEAQTLWEAWDCLGKNLDGSNNVPTKWVFHCSGPRYNELVSRVEQLSDSGFQNVDVGPGLSQRDWVKRMEASHIALVTMVPGSEQVVMPSKTYSAMCAGQAILAIAPEKSDLVYLIKKHDCGWWVEPGDVDGFCGVIKEIAHRPELVLNKRKNSFKAGHESYSQKQLAVEWMDLFNSLVENRNIN